TATGSVLLALLGVPAGEGDDVSVRIRAIRQPLIVWLWIGGAIMAVGALLAALVVLIGGPLGEHLNYYHVAMLLLGAVPLVIPPLFNAIMQRLTAPLRRLPDGKHAPFPRLGFRILAAGVVLQTCCSIMLGVSLALVILAVRSDVDVWGMLPALVAKLAAATVLGFVIPTPAGLGTREWAIMVLLQDQIGLDFAALVALVIRLTWLVTECVIVSILFPCRWAFDSTEKAMAES
ncbi:MAG TPA: hypothetical protein PKD72_12835, partial [Gemmatales bacterium]|nr:hypothetical protein [Gemmatales bacterium]